VNFFKRVIGDFERAVSRKSTRKAKVDQQKSPKDLQEVCHMHCASHVNLFACRKFEVVALDAAFMSLFRWMEATKHMETHWFLLSIVASCCLISQHHLLSLAFYPQTR
jgi:hypothetical protein